MNKAVIISAVRTPLGRFCGTISDIGATDLGGLVIQEAVRRAGIDAREVNECIMGMVLPCGYGQNPAKQASIKAELPQSVEAVTINKVCGSALKAVMLAAQAIQCGDAEIIVAGGMESMSSAPYYVDKKKWDERKGPIELEDHMIHDGLWDIVNDFHMGMSNEKICEKYQVGRDEQDKFAEESYKRALRAIDNDLFIDEIIPVHVELNDGSKQIFEVDECPIETNIESLQNLKPVFKSNGVGTAGNASVISDGAAAVVVMNKDKAMECGCEILAEVGAQASAGIELEHVLMGPILAIPKVLQKQGLSLADIDLFEINEAFSGASVAINKVLGLDSIRVNVNGGAVAMGHPIGACGGRLLVSILYEMRRRDAKRGLVSLCVGGGEAVAMIVNR